MLGTLPLRAGQRLEAVNVVGRGIALAPYTPSLYALISDCDEAMGKTAEAIDVLKRGLSLFPEVGSFGILAPAHLLIGRTEKIVGREVVGIHLDKKGS